MKTNLKFIKEQFKNIVKTYNLKWVSEGEYGIKVENNKVSIIIESERWESGYILLLFDKIKNKSYLFDEILIEKEGEYDSTDFYLTEEEKIISENLPQNEEFDDYNIYLFRIILEKYAVEILSQ